MTMRRRLLAFLPVWILLIGAGATALLVSSRSTPPKKPLRHARITVETAPASQRDIQSVVHSYGTVVPRMESEIRAEISGRIESVSEAFEVGRFFDAQEPLLQIEREDYAIAVRRAEAVVERRLSERSIAEADLVRLKALHKKGSLSFSEFERAKSTARVARASAAESLADVDSAKGDLRKTSVVAPYRGSVAETFVGEGEFVVPGSILAKVFAVDGVEARLPIRYEDLLLLESSSADGTGTGSESWKITLRSNLSGDGATWNATALRVESEVEVDTQMVRIVARVDDPYRLDASDPETQPLRVGMFVDAEISGGVVEDAIVLPSTAIRDQSTVYVVGEDGRVRSRSVRPIRFQDGIVVIGGGLEGGEQVVVSALELVVEGMPVTVKPQAISDPGEVMLAQPAEERKGAPN